MSKKQKLGRCVHCLAVGPTTKDHGVPRSWYPDTSMETAQRVTAPSCRPCNARLSLVEEKVLIPLALSLDADSPHEHPVLEPEPALMQEKFP